MKLLVIFLVCVGLVMSNAFRFGHEDQGKCGAFCPNRPILICAYDRNEGLYVFYNFCFMNLANRCRYTRFKEVDPFYCNLPFYGRE